MMDMLDAAMDRLLASFQHLLAPPSSYVPEHWVTSLLFIVHIARTRGSIAQVLVVASLVFCCLHVCTRQSFSGVGPTQIAHDGPTDHAT